MTLNDLERKNSADYEGELNANRMRDGQGKEVHRRKHGNEYYTGSFHNDAYNGYGYYKYDSIFSPKWAYEGSFFSNTKDGYGQLSLPDNTYFEGLYQNDRPFGPGVLTRGNGGQDVGFWLSSSIIRLIKEVPSEIKELSTTPENIAYLARFKKLLEVAPPKSIASKVAAALNIPDGVAPQLYSKYCKDSRNFLFNYDEFERSYFHDLKKMSDLMPLLSEDDFSLSSLEEAEEKLNSLTTNQEEDTNNFEHSGEFTYNENTETGKNNEIPNTVDETSSRWERARKRKALLLAWNNSPLIGDIMTHTFVNRIYEKTVGFNVAHLLCYRREHFESEGPLEWACVQILKSSNDGDVKNFTQFLCNYHLNINVQDSKGNGCVIRAAAGDHQALLYLTFLYGADMNNTNDEGFTALNHTLTRYLALIYNVRNWGSAFLPKTLEVKEEVKARIWRKCSGTTLESRKSSSKSTKTTKSSKVPSVNSIQTKKSQQYPAQLHTQPQKSLGDETRYIFDLRPTSKVIRHPTSSTKNSPKGIPVEESENSIEKTERLNGITEVYKTLDLLISLMVDTNVSNVPQSAIILALFSGDVELVNSLLEAGADPNARMSREEGWLTPLHILCLAKPQSSFPKIMDLLLEHGADPNSRAAIGFSQENREFVLHGLTDEKFIEVGVTPLQALLLRSDSTFVEGKEVLKELLLKLHDLTMKEPYYMGHSFLSLAVIRMNLAFIFSLLHIFSEDPNEKIDAHWGNIATAYLIYLGATKDPEAIITLIELEQAGMNPLRIVETVKDNEDEENAINFGLRMMKGKTAFTEFSKATKGKSIVDKKEGRNSRGSHNLGTKKSSPTMTHVSTASRGSRGKRVHRELLKKVTLLQDLGRDKVDKYVRGVVVRRLIKHLREKDYQGRKVDKADYPIKQAINWFASEDEFVQVLTHNVLAGSTFISKADVNTVYNIMHWENSYTATAVIPARKMTTHRDSLGQTDKVLLRQLKEAISCQLQSGTAPEAISTAKGKIAPSGLRKRGSKGHSMNPKLKQDEPRVHDSETHELNEGSLRTAEEITHEQNCATFLKKVETLLVISAPHVRWAKRYGAKTFHLPKRQTYRTDFFPEVDKNPFLYRVCYKCVKRDSALQLCPVCRLIWYCSSQCNVRDVMNQNSNHRCKADFYGRGEMWRQYDFDENGDIIRIPRKGQLEWEEEDMLNDGLLKKYGKKIGTNHVISSGSGKYGKKGTGDKDDHGREYSGASREGIRKGSGKRGGNGNRGRLRSEGRLKHQVRHGPDNKYQKVGQERKPIETGGKAHYHTLGKRGDKKARLREKRELKMREARKLRELRNKMPKGVMGDFMKWGLMRMQDLQEKPWYQNYRTDRESSKVTPGETGQLDSFDRLRNQLHMLEELARVLGFKGDFHNFFPWVVLRDGELYYKFDPTTFVLENYSFN